MTSDRPCNNLLIGVTGALHCLSIHAYLQHLRASFAANIRVIMTAAAAQMVAPETVALFVDDRVFTDAWDSSPSIHAAHIQLTRWAETFLVLPATANVLGKAASGIADTLLTTAILSSPVPVIFAPSMNLSMWRSPAVQRNVLALRSDGHVVIEPIPGYAASTHEPEGGLVPSPELVFQHLMQVRMRALRREPWEEAVAERPRSPGGREHQASAASEPRTTKGGNATAA